MRRAVTVAQKADGKWVTLALPNIPIKKQKIALKELKASMGKVGKTEYKMAILLFTPGKKVKFKPDQDPRILVADDLTNMAETELKKVITDEKLDVKFDEDHEKVRKAIRKIRADKAAAEKKKGKKGAKSEDKKTPTPPVKGPVKQPETVDEDPAKEPETVTEPSRKQSK